MSEHEEFMPLFADIDTDKENKCVVCKITLNHMRDGRTDSNHRCRNCYWREQNSRGQQNIVKMNCYRCENTFDWKLGIGNICDDCTE